MASGSCKDKLASALHSLRHLPWVRGAWEGKKETEEMVCVPEEGPSAVCPATPLMDAHRRSGNRVGRAGSPHQDATLEFLNALTPPHPHSHSMASGVPLEIGRETILCSPRPSGKHQNEDLLGGQLNGSCWTLNSWEAEARASQV